MFFQLNAEIEQKSGLYGKRVKGYEENPVSQCLGNPGFFRPHSLDLAAETGPPGK